jgi:hypothetical protein
MLVSRNQDSADAIIYELPASAPLPRYCRPSACSKENVPDACIRVRASKYSLHWDAIVAWLRGFQDSQQSRSAAKEVQFAASGGSVLVATGSRAKVVAEFVLSATEPGGCRLTKHLDHHPAGTAEAGTGRGNP